MNKIQKTNWRVLAALALSLLAVNSVRAANINWGTPTTISADSNVSTAGSLLYAYTLGGDSSAQAISLVPTTVNNVTFQPFAVPFFSTTTATANSVSLAISGGDRFLSGNLIAGSISPGSAFLGLSSEYRSLLASGVSSFNGVGILTLTLGGLTQGQNYSLQLWSNDSGKLTDRLGGTTYTAGNSITLDNNTANADGAVGQWVIGGFTANATTQVLTISSSISTDFQAFNAFQLRAVPEPGMLALLGLGAVVIAGFSWNRRRVIRG